ncbi:NAD(P)H-dependent flavin oxidoreductase [Zhongshania guokunii]|uniref:Propionate 3-nitronate monooxygenase n=1 Tax=Zhongshania guokunii TaxID=641783 RepID=A0ABV3U5L4_9GAMM
MNLKELLGIDLPIIQAPMAGVQDHALAVAVSNAGGLGSLPCAMLSSDALQKELSAITRQTAMPYNVNFFCHVPPVPDPKRERQWRQALAPYYIELGIDVDNIPEQAGRRPFSHEAADVLEEFKPPVVSFHFGLPAADLMARIRGWGGKIMSTATSVDEALWLEARGVDAIIAQGLEAGGHRGSFLVRDISTQVGTFALLPLVVQAVKVPVIAAGGIADSKGVAAAIGLGATAAQLGTAYLLCPEATTSSIHRAALQSDAARVTALTNLFSGGPARGIVNRLMRELGPINSAAPDFPLATTAIAPLRAKAESQDSGDFSPLWAGQNVSGCKAVLAGQLTRDLAGANASIKAVI